MTAPLTSPEAELLLFEVRAIAARGAWPEVSELVASRAQPGWLATYPELALLAAEADLRLGRHEKALGTLESVLVVLERRGDGAGLRRALNLIGAAHFELGNLDEAERAFERTLELANEAGEDLLVARATNNLALIANIRGQHQGALALYQLAVASYQRIGSAAGLAGAFHNMAISYRDLHRLAEADDCERRAIEFARQAKDRRLPAVAQVGRAELLLLRGEAVVAEAGARIAAQEFAAIPDPVGEADALRLVGSACAAQGAPAKAVEPLDRAIHAAREHGSALIEAESLRARGEVRLALDDPVGACDDALAAVAIFDRLGATDESDELRHWVARVARPWS